ncbi:MAG: hypothetical protein R3F50_08080 [Gammaproteobacteria bacterium]
MIKPEFQAAMTEDELLEGEERHQTIEQSRTLAMAAGLIKSSDELRETWAADPEAYKTLLNGAVAAYEHNELVEELLRGAIARLVSVVDQENIPEGLIEL